jgi:lipopolysaccharide transport system ATP-binding protein
MDKNIAIKVKNVTKTYQLYNSHADRVRETFNPFRKKYHRPFNALTDISFEVKRGETLGIIGQNGSGKSTLLQIICGILNPTSGVVEANGRISALLELGAGFNPEFTGIENVYLNGSIMGYSKEEMDNKIQDILTFADIGDFVYQPVKTYSSGMHVRLAFSVATILDPDILIVDEVLSVGDMFFQAKSMARMKNMIDNEETTLVFVSHDVGAAKSLCEKSILLDKGQIVAFGKSDEVVEKYFKLKVHSEQPVLNQNGQPLDKLECKVEEQSSDSVWDVFVADTREFDKRVSFQRIQNGKVRFLKVSVLDDSGREIRHAEFGQAVTLRMAVEVYHNAAVLLYGYNIRDNRLINLVYSDSVLEGKSLIDVKPGDRFLIDWKFKLSLMAGMYNIAVVLSIPIDLQTSQVDYCDRIPIACQLDVFRGSSPHLYSPVKWDNEVIITPVSAIKT